MQISKILPGTLMSLALFASPVAAQSPSCSLDGVILNCSSQGKSAAKIMNTFSSQETRDLLSNPLAEKSRFTTNGSLEKYRASLEKTWRTITRLARQQERNKKRRRMSEAEFQTWAAQFNEAEQSYEVALDFYRQLHWRGVK